MKIIGHTHILTYLSQGLRTGKMNPSLIFSGPEGVGRKTVALQLAKAFFCETLEPKVFVDECSCGACQRVATGNHPDVLLMNKSVQATLIKEKAETQTVIKIESVRHMEKFLHLKPSEGARRICIIEDADKFSSEAANAFLKTLEEPPYSSLIVLLSLSEKNMLSTVLSRCAVLRFRPVPAVEIAHWLERHHHVPADESNVVAALAQGSFSKALRAMGEKEVMDLDHLSLDEFFSWLAESAWKKEARQKAEKVLNVLIESTRKKMQGGDLSQKEKIQHLLLARRQLDRHVPSKLVLENVFVKLQPVFK